VRRPYLLLLIAAGVIVFLAISALLARVFSADGDERAAIESLVRAEARGDQAAIRSMIDGCAASAACQARVAINAQTLRLPGSIKILNLTPSSGFSLTGSTGTARVAWTAGGSLPIVQCIRVHRAGNVFSGLSIHLLTVSKRIKSDQDCPAHY
jgi:hypothetical protein